MKKLFHEIPEEGIKIFQNENLNYEIEINGKLFKSLDKRTEFDFFIPFKGSIIVLSKLQGVIVPEIIYTPENLIEFKS